MSYGVLSRVAYTSPRIREAGLRFQREAARRARPVEPSPAVVALVQQALDGFAGVEAACEVKPVPLYVFKQAIFQDAIERFQISLNDLLSKRRSRRLVFARMYAAQRLSDESPASLPMIGRMLGGLDHTTIIHYCRPDQRRRVKEALADPKAWLPRHGKNGVRG